MKPLDNDHYFSRQPNTPHKIRKIFESIRSHSLTLQTSSGIFSPDGIDKGTRILIENLTFPDPEENMNILEIGAGYGPVVIWLNKEYNLLHHSNSSQPPIPTIYASEINERAIWLLNRNIIANNSHNIKMLKGDFREHIKELKEKNIKFKAIFTNPPLKIGHEILLEIFSAAFDLLSPEGYMQYIHLKKLGAPGFLNKLQQLKPDWNFYLIKKKAGYHLFTISKNEMEFEDDDSYGGYF